MPYHPPLPVSMVQNYLAHTCKCVPGLACTSSGCNFADKLTGLSALSHDVSCLKDRIWLNHEITNAAVELPTAGHRTQDAAFRCHIPVCLTEHQHQHLLHKSLCNASAGKSADHSTRDYHSSCLVSILISLHHLQQYHCVLWCS